MKPIFSFFAIFQNIFRSAIDEAVAILDADDRGNSSRVLNLLHTDFR